VDEGLESAKERAWREVAAIDQAYERGELDDEGWHAEAAKLVVPAYLAANTPQGGSGHSGTADDWEYSRGIVAEALDRSGTFLDIGCANGLLMASVARWGRGKGLSVEPYGLEISAELADLARSQLPHWADRIHVGNALGWMPPIRFDVVRTGLEYVPRPRAAALISWLLEHAVAPDGRLVIGKFNEETERRALEEEAGAWGFRVAGSVERPHRSEPRLAYRLFWIDARG
jgi:2-polyprenyl-3-methyl-5-hydroxy-6-metoxy-1,4-benzoquinol methylase